ncbi:hypothetical protein GCM10023188_34540 [Pontibacter saemangeumensis]|uniref:Uncharacterized protein n=1 Tax=Pontibacter saemangeumensis TaxID=1084525 RepID=A0ABP8LZ69_9BACT
MYMGGGVAESIAVPSDALLGRHGLSYVALSLVEQFAMSAWLKKAL